MPLRPRCALLAALAAAALGACQAPSEQGGADHARSTVRTLLGSCAREDREAILHLLARPARDELIRAATTLEGCLRVVPLADGGEPADLEAFAEAEVAGATVEGGFATVRVEGPTGAAEVELESLGQRWYVGDPEAVAPSEEPPAEAPPAARG